MKKAGRDTGFKMIESEVIFGALKIPFDLPATTAEGQAACFGVWAMRVGEIAMVGLGGIGRPVDHQPEFFPFTSHRRNAGCSHTSHHGRIDHPRFRRLQLRDDLLAHNRPRGRVTPRAVADHLLEALCRPASLLGHRFNRCSPARQQPPPGAHRRLPRRLLRPGFAATGVKNPRRSFAWR
jgi:hypothetical protein